MCIELIVFIQGKRYIALHVCKAHTQSETAHVVIQKIEVTVIKSVIKQILEDH